MSRPLAIVNLAGVLALGGLCILQWQHDRLLNLHLESAEQASLDQEQRLRDQAGQLQGAQDDLARFKLTFVTEHAQRQAAEKKSQAADSAEAALAAECDQLKTSITNWMAAVVLRDKRMQEANERIQRLSVDLDASARKFNNLVTNYNALARDYNTINATNAARAAIP